MVRWWTGFPFIMPAMQQWATDLAAKTKGRTSRSLAARGAPSLSPATLPLMASLHADVFAMTEPDPRSDSQLSQPTSQLELSVSVLSKLATALPRNLKGVALTSLPLAMRLRHLHPATAWSHVPSARGSGRRSPIEKGVRTVPTRAYGGRAPTRPVLCCRRAAVVPLVARVEADGAGRRLREEGQLRGRGQDPL